MHYFGGEIPENYHRFALFHPLKMGTSMIPVYHLESPIVRIPTYYKGRSASSNTQLFFESDNVLFLFIWKKTPQGKKNTLPERENT